MANVLNPETESITLNTELEMPTLEHLRRSRSSRCHESTSNPETAEVNPPALDADAPTEPVAAHELETTELVEAAPAPEQTFRPQTLKFSPCRTRKRRLRPAAEAEHVDPTRVPRGCHGRFLRRPRSFRARAGRRSRRRRGIWRQGRFRTVLKQTEKHLVVDVGLKSEGLVPLEQVVDHTGAVKFKPGDVIEVVIEREEPEGGYLVSYEKAQRLRVWDVIEKAANEKTPVIGTIVSRVKGGLTVDIGMKAFLPGSQLEIRPVRNLDGYLGQQIEVRVIKLNKKRGNVVVCRKEILEEEQNAKRSPHPRAARRRRSPHRHRQEPHRLRRVR